MVRFQFLNAYWIWDFNGLNAFMSDSVFRVLSDRLSNDELIKLPEFKAISQHCQLERYSKHIDLFLWKRGFELSV